MSFDAILAHRSGERLAEPSRVLCDGCGGRNPRERCRPVTFPYPARGPAAPAVRYVAYYCPDCPGERLVAERQADRQRWANAIRALRALFDTSGLSFATAVTLCRPRTGQATPPEKPTAGGLMREAVRLARGGRHQLAADVYAAALSLGATPRKALDIRTTH